jgi:hypothetical protein
MDHVAAADEILEAWCRRRLAACSESLIVRSPKNGPAAFERVLQMWVENRRHYLLAILEEALNPSATRLLQRSGNTQLSEDIEAVRAQLTQWPPADDGFSNTLNAILDRQDRFVQAAVSPTVFPWGSNISFR